MKSLKLGTFLPDRIDRVAAEINRWLAAVHRDEFGLSLPEWRALATLGELEVCTATEISAHCQLHKTEVSRALTALRKRRWVSKTANKEDRREELVKLTASGRRSYAKLIVEMRNVERALTAMLGAGQTRSLEKALAALETALQEA
jgi:DNA-binding MarR family transcriptional regulator